MSPMWCAGAKSKTTTGQSRRKKLMENGRVSGTLSWRNEADNAFRASSPVVTAHPSWVPLPLYCTPDLLSLHPNTPPSCSLPLLALSCRPRCRVKRRSSSTMVPDTQRWGEVQPFGRPRLPPSPLSSGFSVTQSASASILTAKADLSSASRATPSPLSSSLRSSRLINPHPPHLPTHPLQAGVADHLRSPVNRVIWRASGGSRI